MCGNVFLSQHTSVCDALQSVKLFNIHHIEFFTVNFLVWFDSIADTWDCAVVNISSVQAHHVQPYCSGWTYQAGKAAVTTMSKCTALDLSAHGIRVNSICPGYVWTEYVMHTSFVTCHFV